MVMVSAPAANCGWIPDDTATEALSAPETMISVEPFGVMETCVIVFVPPVACGNWMRLSFVVVPPDTVQSVAFLFTVTAV